MRFNLAANNMKEVYKCLANYHDELPFDFVTVSLNGQIEIVLCKG